MLFLSYQYDNIHNLYNLETDISEENNIALSNPEKVAELKTLLNQKNAEITANKRPIGNRDYLPPPDSTAVLPYQRTRKIIDMGKNNGYYYNLRGQRIGPTQMQNGSGGIYFKKDAGKVKRIYRFWDRLLSE